MTDTTKFAEGAKKHENISGAALDIALVVVALLVLKSALLEIDALWTYAGPIALLSALAIANWRLGRTGQSWSDLGLKRPDNIPKILFWSGFAIVAGVLAEAITTALFSGVTTEPETSNSGRFADLPGNTPLFIYWLAVAWIIGGFVEEMLFRGFLITRFEQLFSGIPLGLIAAIVLPAILFGQQHYYYQGMSGALATGAVALVSGVLYLLFKRSLWPLVLSHGLTNTVGLTLIYTGIQPAV